MDQACQICGVNNWSLVYSGAIRTGAFGNDIPGVIFHCGGCGVDRLDEEMCISQEAYESQEYRLSLEQGLSITDFFRQADPIQIHNLSAFWPLNLREKRIADVGCGAGSFLDHIASLAKEAIAIEPTAMYQASLKHRGYSVFNYTADALEKHRNELDFVFSFQVIEHVEDPKLFVEESLELLKPGGNLVLATPNRDDILMKLLPDEFPSFFYRIAHRWYFDQHSLECCVLEASGGKGVKISIKFIHTFGLSNTLFWLKEKCPKGVLRMDGIDSSADELWAAYLQSTAQSDTIYMLIEKTSG